METPNNKEFLNILYDDPSDCIYLDSNATTEIDPIVIAEIISSLKVNWANPSSSYARGIQCKEVIQLSRRRVASMISANESEIKFTSCGTESNNIILESVLLRGKKVHIISTDIEHPSIANYLLMLQDTNQAEVTFINVARKEGRHFVEAFVNNLRYNTVLVIAMLANNETGIIHPIEELGRTLHTMKVLGTVNDSLKFHTDACQAVGKIAINVNDLCCDYLSMSAHKFNGPRIGVLYAKKDCVLRPIMFGGGQEMGIRPGTENTPMIAGLGKACELVTENLSLYRENMKRCCDIFITELRNEFKERFVINNNGLITLPNTCNFSILNSPLSGRELLNLCPLLNASVGAACHTYQKSLSKVLLASGVGEDLAYSAVRMSTSRFSTEVEMHSAARMIVNAVNSRENA